MRLHTAPQVSFQGGMRLSLGRKGQYVHITAWLKLPLIQTQRSLQGMLGMYFWDSLSRCRPFCVQAQREGDERSFYQVSVVSLLLHSFPR